MKGKNGEATEEFLNYIKDITKDEGFYLMDNGYIDWKDMGGVQEGGSETAAELFKSIISLEAVCELSIEENRNYTYSSGNTIQRGIIIGTQGVLNKKELYAILVHEATHYLTDYLNFEEQILYCFKTDDEKLQSSIKGYVSEMYMEALAMTVEDICRQEMGISLRSEVIDKVIGSNNYGQFPVYLTTDPTAIFRKGSSLKGKKVMDYVFATTLRSKGTEIGSFILNFGRMYGRE